MTDERFCLPDLGEGLTDAQIVTWRVGLGDHVEINDPLVEVETAKSVVELPSPYAGAVSALHAAEGDTVPVGGPLLDIRTTRAEREPVLVGYGAEPGSTPRRRHVRRPAGPAHPVRAKPPVRKLARDLGIDLSGVAGSGPDGLITRSDLTEQTTAPSRHSSDDGTTRVDATAVRRATAAAVTASAFGAPHVTEFLTVDVTRSVKLLDRFRDAPEFVGTAVTMLTLVARALLVTVRSHPEIGGAWDDDAQQILLHRNVNLGIATASERGLLVPNIKQADTLRLPELAGAIHELVGRTRAGHAAPADLTGGTITITNIGCYGVDAGTPILNPGEAAILCMGAIRRRPWEHRDRVALRHTLTLSLSVDHRLIDGELASRALSRIGRILENPRWELLLS